MREIRILVSGGLGNQLFIWNFAHRIHLDTGYKVKLIYIIDKKTRIDRPILIFDLQDYCSHGISIEQQKFVGILFRILDKLQFIYPRIGRFAKRIVGIWDESSSRPQDMHTSKFIRGFFQSGKLVEATIDTYLPEIESLLGALRVPNNIVSDSVVAHVRRGDFRSAADPSGLLAMDYYLLNIPKNRLIIFCTDEEMFKESILEVFPYAVVMTPQELGPWETIAVMSHATYVVTANSTFSWWGAILARQLGSAQVLLPLQWRPNCQTVSIGLGISDAEYAASIFERKIK